MASDRITREAFVAEYAKASGISPDYLLTIRRPIECDCGARDCTGWAMLPVEP